MDQSRKNDLSHSTPRQDVSMPGEFEPHAGTWMLWHQRPDNWRLGCKPAQKAFVSVAEDIARFEPVSMGVNPDQYANVRSLIPERIRVLQIPHNDACLRDCGPTFVSKHAKAISSTFII